MKKRNHHAGGGSKAGYTKEYKRDHSSTKDKKDRAARNAARNKLNKWHLKHKGQKIASSKDVDHKDGNPRNNSKDNLRTEDAGSNRSRENRKRSRYS